jgi:hypothetical protein
MDTGLGGLGVGKGDGVGSEGCSVSRGNGDILDVADTAEVCGWLGLVRNGLNSQPGANFDAREACDAVWPAFLELDVDLVVFADRVE